MTIKLEVGKSYKTRGGDKVTIDGFNEYDKYMYKERGSFRSWTASGEYDNYWGKHKWDIIAEWEDEVDLTKIEKPFGLLDKETQERLKAHGGPYQFYHSGGWFDEPDELKEQFDYWVWRVKPKPTVEYKKTDFILSKASGYSYIVTEKFVDGKYDSYTVDMVPF